MPSANELVQTCTSVFTLPEMYSRVRDVVDDANATMEDLANVLKLDPPLSVRLLRIANSSQYGAPKQIDTITRAAKTGSVGDGKIFVSDLNSVVRIRTGETGESAL